MAASLRKSFEDQERAIQATDAKNRKRDELLLLLLLLLARMRREGLAALVPIARDAAYRTLARLGIDTPELRKRIEKELRRSILDQVRKYLDSINATTADLLFAELATVGDDLAHAAITRVFADAINTRAVEIASTEAVRAFHIGMLTAAEKSEKVLFKQWATQIGACPLCLELESMGPIPLDQPFTETAYGEVQGPALHPSCRCSLILSQEP